MKKYTLIIAALASLTLHAQETKLSLEVIPGKLANQLTEEQMSTVTELTLTGEMYNCDFYTIRDKMPKLLNLDLKNALADTIPNKALHNKQIHKIILPLALKYIGEEGLVATYSGMEIVFTGDFPNIVKTSFLHSDATLSVSEDNQYCKIIKGYLCSMDNKKLYLASRIRSFAYIPDGIETICKWAFNNSTAIDRYIAIPSSVKRIEDEAFSYIYMDHPTGGGSDDIILYCCCEVPPALGNNVFELYESWIKEFINLYVPKGCSSIYQDDPEWCKVARYIEETDYFPQDWTEVPITKNKSILKITAKDRTLSIQSDIVMRKIELMNNKGSSFFQTDLFATSFSYNISEPSGFYLIQVTFSNGKKETAKIIIPNS